MVKRPKPLKKGTPLTAVQIDGTKAKAFVAEDDDGKGLTIYLLDKDKFEEYCSPLGEWLCINHSECASNPEGYRAYRSSSQERQDYVRREVRRVKRISLQDYQRTHMFSRYAKAIGNMSTVSTACAFSS